jgi:hypothetical protein
LYYLQASPKDNALGGTITFEFLRPARVATLQLVNIKSPNPAGVHVTQWDGTVVALQSVITGSNGVYTMPINVANARELSVTLAGSGAIAHIAYHMCSGENDPNSQL